MIEVKFKKLSSTTLKGFAIIEQDTSNKIAELLAKKIKKDLGLHKCEEHPSYPNVITVEAKRGLKPKLILTSACCDKFKSTLVFK